MNTGDAYLLHSYCRVSNRESGFKYSNKADSFHSRSLALFLKFQFSNRPKKCRGTACRAPSDETKFSRDSQPRAQLLSQRAVSGHRRIRLIRVGRGPLILLEHLEKTVQRVNQFAARNTAFPELNA